MNRIQYIPSTSAKLAFIGIFPDKVDCLRRQPFTGPTGHYFSRLIKTAGIDKSQVYLTNIVHQQAPNNIYNLLPTSIREEGKKQLKEDLEKWKLSGLTTIVAMGNEVLELLTGKSNIHRYRGSVMPCTFVDGLKVYPVINPGNIIRGEGKYEPIFIMDCKKALEDCETSEIIYPHHDIQIIRHKIDAIALLQTYSNVETPIVIDIETAGPKMTAYGWAINPQKAFVITSELLEDPTVLKSIGHFTKSSTPKIFHNCLYDVFHNAYYYKILNNNIFFDTMVAQHSVYPTLPKSLAFCASIYTKEPYWKDEGKEAMDELKRGKLSWENLYIYNGKDCCLTYEIYLALKQEIKDWGVEKVFQDTMQLIGPALYAQMRGLLVDNKDNWAYTCASTRLTHRNTKIIEKLEKIKEEIVGNVNVNSPKQMAELIYGTWDFPKPKGRIIAEPQEEESGGTTGEKQLRLLARYPTPYQAAIGLLIALKKQKKMSTFFNPNVDSDNHVRCSVKVTGTYTGRLSTSKSITGSGCVPEDHEVLTRHGWINIKDAKIGEEIACWQQNKVIKFLPIQQTIEKDYNDLLITSSHSLHPHKYTKEHRVPWQRPNRPFNVESADTYAKRSVTVIPSSGHFYEGKKHDPNFLRLVAMTQADFSIEGSAYIRGAFKKERKQERVRNILTINGLCWEEKYTREGTLRFSVPAVKELVSFLGPKKLFSWQLLQYDHTSLQAFVDEIGYWDAHRRGNSYIYYTTVKENAEIVATIAHLVGKSSSTNINYDNNNGYGQGNNKPLYMVNIKTKDSVYQENFSLIRYEQFSGKVYCVTVPTTFFLCRYKNQIIVTGNSNLQNQPKEAREVYIAEDGFIFGQSDLSQSEARIVAALCGDPAWLKEFDLKDLHTAVAALLFNTTPDKIIKWQRDIAKKIAHGTHYGMGPMLLSEILGCTPKQAKQYRDRYLEIRYKVVDWHKNVANKLITERCIKTPFGRIIQFFGPITENEGQNFSKVHREAIAAEPQSISVSYINQGIIKCYNEIPEFDFRNQVHDSILFQLPDDSTTIERVLRKMKDLIEVDLTVNNITFRIPLNFELGYNWKNMIELKSLDDVKKVHKQLQFSRLSTLNLL